MTETCCDSPSDSLYDLDSDGQITMSENMGIAFVVYQNTNIGTTDSLRAFILDPDNQTESLFIETLNIASLPIELQINSANSFSSINLDKIENKYFLIVLCNKISPNPLVIIR